MGTIHPMLKSPSLRIHPLLKSSRRSRMLMPWSGITSTSLGISRIDTNGQLTMHLLSRKHTERRRNRLKDMVCKVSKKKSTDVIPWLSPDVQRQLLHHKQTNKGFWKRSRQSKLNKITSPKVGTRHTQGSISAAAIAKKMRKGGETVTAAKLFSKTHTKHEDKTFADDRSKVAWEKYKLLILAKQVPVSEEDDSLLLEAVGGWSEKGTVYGLGNSVGLFYEKASNNATANKLLTLPLSLHNSRLN